MSEAAESVSLRPDCSAGTENSRPFRAVWEPVSTNKQTKNVLMVYPDSKSAKIQHTFKTLIFGNLYVYSGYLGKILKNTELY